jgi:hypothetical protein
MSEQDNRIYAYEIHEPRGMTIHSAPPTRAWMDETEQRYAYRCLPLSVANQAGWWIECPCTFMVRWNGGTRKQDLEMSFEAGQPDARIVSHFGYGVITFTLPYLFRTPPGINLWVKGPTNLLKDGAQALEGIVETDWNPATFTMNWKMTSANYVVRFEKGEPICMLVPVPRGLAEGLIPIQTPLQNNAALREEYQEWQASRSQFLTALTKKDEDAVKRGWQKDYFKGLAADGERVDGHQTKLNLKEFHRVTTPHEASCPQPG